MGPKEKECSCRLGGGSRNRGVVRVLSSFLATVLSQELLVSKGKVGLIVGVYFGATGLGSILSRRITERLGARISIVVDMAIVAICSFLVAVIGTYSIWLIASVLAGAAYGLSNTGTNVVIGKVIAAEKRTLAMSVKTSGVPLMAALASAIGPWSTEQWKWELILMVNGGVAICVGVSALLIVPNRLVDSVDQNKDKAPAEFLLVRNSVVFAYSWFTATIFMDSLVFRGFSWRKFRVCWGGNFRSLFLWSASYGL